MDNMSEMEWDEVCYFAIACKTGDIDKAKMLHKSGVDIHLDDDAAFRFACEYGHFEIAKWLHSLALSREEQAKRYAESGTIIHAEDNYAFVLACRNKHMLIVEWLLELGVNIDIYSGHAENGNVFDDACLNGHVDMGNWLRDHGCSVYLDVSFVIACCSKNDSVETVQWLYDLGADIHCDNAFFSTVYYRNYKILQWLYNLDNMFFVHRLCSDESVLKRAADMLNMSDTTIELLLSIKKGDELPIIDDIEDVVIKALFYYNKITDLERLNLPYVSYDVKDGKIINGTIKRLRAKNARKLFHN